MNSTCLKPHAAAAPKRCRNGRSLKKKDRFAARRGMDGKISSAVIAVAEKLRAAGLCDGLRFI